MTRRPAVAAALLAAAALAASATLAAATPAALAAAPTAIATTATTVTELGAALAEQASDTDPSTAAKKKTKKSKKTKKKAKKVSKKKARKASKKRWKRAATHTTAPAPAAAPAPAPAVAVPTSTEDYVTILINHHRTANGCAPLHTNTNLTNAARAYSTDMATHNYFSHTGRDGSTFVQRAHAAGYPNPGGENIAWGYATATDVTTGWMNSPGHRANILNCTFTTTGVGIATNPNGTPYYTQLFGR